ncbi:uncharacterized protein K489DRAFT_399014 [Dissoconium aciculare CBS 342.82]|uniref:MARVEL domain-containing protein n=1 Tax=Dissoconium aciculare CBS 342.82 TaxID=1314786 RepID=A0A6J3MGG7_9PEZI|nr:uncharacterized protein K489DRAFT_399014 [Dissoconium aciculare CBS 342.82]KAF1826774.1 hypothetical protein K489DRAFT_399014 [Dissoconium aciculare CBS 342.82]
MALGGISGIGNSATHVLLFITAIIIIGLSASLTNSFQYYTDLCNAINIEYPSENAGDCGVSGWLRGSRFGIFVGVWGLLAAILALATTLVSTAIITLVAITFDGLATVFYLAGAINLTVLFRRDGGENGFCSYAYDDTDALDTCRTLESRVRADLAFMWIGFVLSIVGLVALLLNRRSK